MVWCVAWIQNWTIRSQSLLINCWSPKNVFAITTLKANASSKIVTPTRSFLQILVLHALSYPLKLNRSWAWIVVLKRIMGGPIFVIVLKYPVYNCHSSSPSYRVYNCHSSQFPLLSLSRSLSVFFHFFRFSLLCLEASNERIGHLALLSYRSPFFIFFFFFFLCYFTWLGSLTSSTKYSTLLKCKFYLPLWSYLFSIFF